MQSGRTRWNAGARGARLVWGALLALALMAATPIASPAVIPITSCGVTVPAGEKGVLQNDVDCGFYCSGDPSIACSYGDESPCDRNGVCEPEFFVLAPGATLDLNGHEISAAYQETGVLCGIGRDDVGRCTVKGPGRIVGGKGSAVATPTAMHLVLKNLTVGGMDTSIYTRGRLTATGLSVMNDRENKIVALAGATIESSQLDGESGLYSEGDVTLRNVELGPTRDSDVEAGGTVRARDVVIAGAGGISARDIVLRNASSVASVTSDRSSFASAKRRLRLVDSDVVSLESGKLPALVRSTCETSTVYGTVATWGVCADD